MTTKIKSVCTYIRKTLKTKGITQHNGRGVFEMEFDINFDELSKRVSNNMFKYLPLLERYCISTNCIRLIFKKEVVKSQYYRTFIIVRHSNGVCTAGVIFEDD
jgi:hypothetical protein